MRSNDYILFKVVESNGVTEVFIEDSADLISTLMLRVDEAVNEAEEKGYGVNWLDCAYATKQVRITNANNVVTYSIVNISRAKVEQFPIWGVYY